MELRRFGNAKPELPVVGLGPWPADERRRLARAALRKVRRRHLLEAAAVAAPVALLVALLPPVGDVPAHLYRTHLVEEGVLWWDPLWFGGHYPLASYSLLYYFPAALIGNEPLVALGTVTSAVLFASIVVTRWGRAARWPARVFALLSAAPLLTGTYPFALGLAAALVAIRALQGGRRWLAVLSAALALGFSPLAFAFLCLVLVAIVAGGAALDRNVTLGLGALAAFAIGWGVAFGPGGSPFPALSLLPLLAVCTLGAALAVRAPPGRPLAALFAVWAVASLGAFLVTTPLGTGLTRIRPVVFPLVLLAAVLAAWRPRWLALGAVAAALAYTAVPYGARLVDASRARSHRAELWAPVLTFLRAEGGRPSTVEVVPTAAHWEAYHLPRAGIPLARGWYRQLDRAENELLYEESMTSVEYLEWLRRRDVRYVVLAPFPLDAAGAEAEAELLRSGRSQLRRVHAERGWRIFEVPQSRG
jgi:hypothetical protein